MADIVAMKDDKGDRIWVNAAWVKLVFDRDGDGSTIEFMDGHQLHLAWPARQAARVLNNTPPKAKPEGEAAPSEAIKAIA